MTEENREERRDDALEARNLAAGSDSESAEKSGRFSSSFSRFW